MKPVEKTNAMRILDRFQIPYEGRTYPPEITDGEQVAATLGLNPNRVFKTLVTVAHGGEHLVFVVPVNRTLDLKKAARVAGVKNVEMIKQKELLPLTGYIHGGCSPIGMKKQFRTFLHQTAREHSTFVFSAGKVGHQVELSAADLQKVIPYAFADLIRADEI